MSARVAFLERPIREHEEQAVTAVNAGAIVQRNGKTVAFIVKGDTAAEAAVSPGGKVGDLIEVREGLQPGDKVVLNPPKQLKSGVKISVPAE
jgi:hypothetical protein